MSSNIAKNDSNKSSISSFSIRFSSKFIRRVSALRGEPISSNRRYFPSSCPYFPSLSVLLSSAVRPEEEEEDEFNCVTVSIGNLVLGRFS